LAAASKLTTAQKAQLHRLATQWDERLMEAYAKYLRYQNTDALVRTLLQVAETEAKNAQEAGAEDDSGIEMPTLNDERRVRRDMGEWLEGAVVGARRNLFKVDASGWQKKAVLR
jgi:hypothetical protein